MLDPIDEHSITDVRWISEAREDFVLNVLKAASAPTPNLTSRDIPTFVRYNRLEERSRFLARLELVSCILEEVKEDFVNCVIHE